MCRIKIGGAVSSFVRGFHRGILRARNSKTSEGVSRWCSGGDLNPHALRHTPLKRTCLPFHHPSVRPPNLIRNAGKQEGAPEITWKPGNQKKKSDHLRAFYFQIRSAND